MKTEIDIYDSLSWVSLDEAIANLQELRKKHPGTSMIDIALGQEAYTGEDILLVTLEIEVKMRND